MKKNIGMQDRVIRVIIGLLLLFYAWWQNSWLALGFSLFTFYEALNSWCIVYQLLGKTSCPIDRDRS